MATTDQSVIFGLEYHTRALAAQQGSSELTRFLVGTCTLKNENQVYLIEYDEDDSQLHSMAFRHSKGEIWHLATSPVKSQLFSSVYSTVDADGAHIVMSAAIYRLPIEEHESVKARNQASGTDVYTMEELMTLDGHEAALKCVIWNPLGEGDQVLSVGEEAVRLWDLNISTNVAKLRTSGSGNAKGHRRFQMARWSPHQNAMHVATADATAVRGWDLRTMSQTYCIENAHGQLVRDIDFNPNKQHYMVTSGDDCLVKFWDTRDCTKPLMTLHHHTHWAWSVRYNHFHDQLVLSAGSDSHVVLSNVASLSSDPYGHLEHEKDDENDEPPVRREPQPDGIIGTYNEHEDSVYAAEWSGVDPWVFASISYDGRLVVNHVPKETKYNILL